MGSETNKEDFNKALVQKIEQARTQRFTYSITSGWDRHELVPSLELKLTGGNAEALFELCIEIQKMVLKHSEAENDHRP